MVKQIQKLIFAAAMLLVAQVAFSQNITLRFTGSKTDGSYIRLDSVHVQNISRSWTETIVYPDTVLTFQQTGIADAQGLAAEIASYPNPFNGTTNVVVTMLQSGEATMQVYNLSGQRVAERTMSLQAGKNLFEVCLQNPQVYLLTVTTAVGRSTVKLLNRGNASENSISFNGCSNVVEKRQSVNTFRSGDVLKITGYATSTTLLLPAVRWFQVQTTGEYFTLYFNISADDAPFFTVSDSTKVIFSPGNLQWSANGGGSTQTTHAVAGGGTAAGTWRFAEYQWNFVGNASLGNVYWERGKCDNARIQHDYPGWIDLFGWATSGYNRCSPFWTETSPYYYGNGNTNIMGTNYDWGVYNAIYNPKTSSTDAPGIWRTLTFDEWNYLLNNRITTSGIRYAKAIVNGVEGLIIVPDNWNDITYHLFCSNSYSALYTSNIISALDWGTLENAGAIFLPGAGLRNGCSISVIGCGNYWSTDCYDSDNAYALGICFSENWLTTNRSTRNKGRSVRLVRDVR